MSTAALAADALAGRQTPEPAPTGRKAPEVASAPRRRRIPGSTTEPLPVRACSGESLGRHTTEARHTEVRRTTETLPTPDARRTVAARRAGERQLRVAPVEAPALRLTRRGRMLVTALSVLVFGSAIVVLGLRVTGVLVPGPDFTHTVPVQVVPGQTLWSIAHDTNPTQDPGTVVEKIADLNKLSSPADIVPGQTLQVPVAR